jgi:hypothetical protein
MRLFVFAIVVATLWPVTSRAQGSAGQPVVEFAVGHAGFADDAMIHHAVFGGSVRWHVSPRVSLGPELVYLRGPESDRDVMLTGNVTFDWLAPNVGRRWTPFLVAGGGLFRHRDRIGPLSFSSTEGAFTTGIGARGRLTDRWFVGGEWRVGWELHSRINAIVGVRLGK